MKGQSDPMPTQLITKFQDWRIQRRREEIEMMNKFLDDNAKVAIEAKKIRDEAQRSLTRLIERRNKND